MMVRAALLRRGLASSVIFCAGAEEAPYCLGRKVDGYEAGLQEHVADPFPSGISFDPERAPQMCGHCSIG